LRSCNRLRQKKKKIQAINAKKESRHTIKAQNIFRLQIAVIDTQRVAVLDGVEKLVEYMLDQACVAEVPAAVQDLREQVSVGSKIHNDIRVATLFHNTVQSHDVRVHAGELVERNFADVELALAGRGGRLRVYETFNSVIAWRMGARLDGAVDDTVATDSEDIDELEGAVVDAGTGDGVRRLGRRAAVVRGVHGRSWWIVDSTSG
jgi:hypothetical protein